MCTAGGQVETVVAVSRGGPRETTLPARRREELPAASHAAVRGCAAVASIRLQKLLCPETGALEFCLCVLVIKHSTLRCNSSYCSNISDLEDLILQVHLAAPFSSGIGCPVQGLGFDAGICLIEKKLHNLCSRDRLKVDQYSKLSHP